MAALAGFLAGIQGSYLCKAAGIRLIPATAMEKIDPSTPSGEEESAAFELAQRLERYRRRVAAEGRPRSVKFIDRAIEDADKKTKRGK